MPVTIRALLPRDLDAAQRLKTEAGWNQGPEDWIRFLELSPGTCLAAEEPGAGVVGTAATIIYGGALAWLSMVLVDQRFRGAGIGTALLDAALARLDGAGVGTVKLDATPQGRPLYEKRGFAAEAGIERWALTRDTAGESAPGRRAFVPVEVDELAALDRAAFGADRRGLLLSVAGETPDFVLRSGGASGGLRGFALARRGAFADHLGPLVAVDEPAAAELLDGFLRRSRRGTVIVDRFDGVPWSAGLLASRGFAVQRTLTRMRRGPGVPAVAPGTLVAIMGPEFG